MLSLAPALVLSSLCVWWGCGVCVCVGGMGGVGGVGCGGESHRNHTSEFIYLFFDIFAGWLIYI